ncbi:FAD-binding domain protein [Xylariaceae sp. FL0255]|nr:FAD-binding domain protein [Xylariaceae sp. FL0255]
MFRITSVSYVSTFPKLSKRLIPKLIKSPVLFCTSCHHRSPPQQRYYTAVAMTANTQKPILISGAGLASLLFAQGLLRAKIPFRIFERDSSLITRSQGYRLRLSSEGLDAIESVLGPEGFKKFWDVCGKTGGAGFAALNALTGEIIKDDGPKPPQPSTPTLSPPNPDLPKVLKESLVSRGGQIVGIARGDMRKQFIEGVEEFIDWGHQVVGYELTESGVQAIFADGSKSIEGELLVGGEGIYSRIADQVSGGKLKVFDTGARGIHGQAPTTAFKQLGEGVWRMADDTRPNGKAFVITNVRSGDMDNENIQFGWTMGAQPGVINPPNDDYTITGAVAADIAKSITANWHPRVKPLFEQMNIEEAAFWKITCSNPSGVPEWTNEPRVTVIGDAAHSMTPAGGIGANTAVQDSALLSRLLAESGGKVDGVTAAYEKGMRVYGSKAVATSYGLAKGQFGVEIDEESTATIRRPFSLKKLSN